MRYQSALVLSTLAVGQAAAGNLRHASFHARRSANIPAGPEGVAWNNVVRDAVDYKAITDKFTAEQWNEIFASQSAAAAQATNAPPAPAPPAPQPTSNAAPAEPSSKKEEPPKTSEAAPEKTKQPSSGGKGSVLSALGCSGTKAPDSPNGKIWKGDSGSKTQVTFTNDADEDSAVFCWSMQEMFTIKSNALIAVDVAGGSSVTLSIAPGFSGGCGAAYADSTFHMSGILEESILEFTTAPENPGMYDFGAYDISREVNMNGIVMSATGNRQCTSGIKNGQVSCVFGCVGGAKSCEATGTYNIIAGVEDSQYCMANGKDPSTGGASGGCQLNRDGDHMKVTYSKNRSWPAATF